MSQRPTKNLAAPVVGAPSPSAASLDRRRLLGRAAAVGFSLAALRSVGVVSAQGDDAPFVVANETEPADLTPFFAGYGAGLVTRQVYETLAEPRLTLNDQGVVEVSYTPKLAERWERVDPTRWRFSLRRDVTFHNGERWDADAAKASFDALSDAATIAQFGRSNLLAAITACEVVDATTVDFVTTRPDTETLGLYLRIGFTGLPPEALRSRGIAGLAENPIGTGAYRFEAWDRGQEIRLSRFADHWDPDGPNMTSVRFIARPESSVRAETVAAGEADFAYNISGEQANTLDHAVIGGGFQSSGIRLNNQIAPTDDLRVRQAINHAIDRAAIAEAIFGGAATPIGFFGFQPVQVEPFAYDPERATALIDEAGVTGAELELVYGEGRIPEEDQLAEIYAASLETIGLRIRLNRVEPLQYNEIGGQPFPQQPPLYLETTSSGNFGDIAGGLDDKYGCEGTGTFCDPAYDAEFAELAALEGEERNRRLQSIAERLQLEETPRAWVVAIQQVHGLSARVETDLPANAYILFDDIRVR